MLKTTTPSKGDTRMKAKQLFIFSLFILMGAYFIMPSCSWAQVMFFDDTLRVKGTLYEFATFMTNEKKTDKLYTGNNIGLMRTKATTELLYNAIDNENYKLNLFGFYQWWYDAAPDINGKMERSRTSRAWHKYQGPYERSDDWINEMYADFYSGPWNIRAGKQIVFWSEVEMVRTIDRINPLDLRYTSPGIDPFDEMKLGLWMLRGFYTTDLPGQIVLEGIFTPDFQRVRTPQEGTSTGSNPAPPVVMGKQAGKTVPYGQNSAIDDMFRKDQRSLKWGNSTFALRIKGTGDAPMFGANYILDWTLSWYHGMNTTPVARMDRLGWPNTLNLDKSTLNGYLNNLAISRVFGAQDIPHAPNKHLWEYKYFDALGASCQSFIPSLKGVLRGEFSYELGLPENTAFTKEIDKNPSYSKVITGTTERDQMNIGITFDRPIRWQWLQDQTWLASSGIIDASFGWYGQRRQGNITHIRRTFGYYERSQSNWTVTLRGNMWHNELYPVLRFLYNAQNWGYGVVALRYVPGKHMRYEAGYEWMFAKSPWDSPEAYSEHKDMIYTRVGYEF